MKTFRKILYSFFLGFFVVALIASAVVQLGYSSNLPPQQDENSGHVYRIVVNHGSVVYGTDREFRAYRWVDNLQPVAVVGAFVVLILGLSFGDLKMRSGRKLNE